MEIMLKTSIFNAEINELWRINPSGKLKYHHSVFYKLWKTIEHRLNELEDNELDNESENNELNKFNEFMAHMPMVAACNWPN